MVGQMAPRPHWPFNGQRAWLQKNALALYEGTVTWGDYNKRRKEINDTFRDEFNKIDPWQ